MKYLKFSDILFQEVDFAIQFGGQFVFINSVFMNFIFIFKIYNDTCNFKYQN